MSGPKTDEYYLSERERKILEERQKLLLETQVASDKLNNFLSKCNESLEGLKCLLSEFCKFSKESGTGEDEISDISQKILDIKRELAAVSPRKELNELIEANNSLKKILEKIDCCKFDYIDKLKKNKLEYSDYLSEIISNSMHLSFSSIGDERKKKENPVLAKIDDAFQRIDRMYLSPEMTKRYSLLKKQVDKISDSNFLQNFYALKVCPFLKECDYYLENIDTFEELLYSYNYLVEELEEKKEYFAFSADNIDKLRSEIVRLNKRVMQKSELEEISKAIDEAIIEMGYDLIGEQNINKENGKKIRCELFGLEMGSAVNVTFSESGQISMEIGILDTTDRKPTEIEALNMVEKMRTFCSDYNRLGAKLEDKGIIRNSKFRLPPLADYAQVFNVSDYNINEKAHEKLAIVSEKKTRTAYKHLNTEG